MSAAQPIYVFDLDGVVTDPSNSQVDESVVGVMYQLLVEGAYVGVNTGRSFEWVEKNLISRLTVEDPDRIFEKFLVICEKGGETVQWQGSSWVMHPSQFALSLDTYTQTKAIFDRLASRLPTMFWDATKRTMATVEKQPQADLDTFHAERQTLVQAWSDAFAGRNVRIDATTVATDVESSSAGKHAGAELIHAWVERTAGGDMAYVCFGDSTSDYEMARYFADQGADTTFVYVGPPTDKIMHHQEVTFIATKAQYAAGTREYFQIDA